MLPISLIYLVMMKENKSSSLFLRAGNLECKWMMRMLWDLLWRSKSGHKYKCSEQVEKWVTAGVERHAACGRVSGLTNQPSSVP